MEENGLTISNTQFLLHNRWLYTWTSPNESVRNQTNYILIQKRWEYSIRNCRSYTGTDISSDHELLMANMTIKMKRTLKSAETERFNIDCDMSKYTIEVKNKFQVFEKLQLEETIQEKTMDKMENGNPKMD